MVAQGYRGERITRIGDIAKSILLLAAATGTGTLFQKINLPESNIIMAYIIGVLFISVATSRRIYGLISSVFSVLAFNYFFTVPYFTLKAYSDDYPVTFLTMFLTAFITSTLAVRMKQQTKDASEAAYRTHILLETNQLIQQQGERREMLRVVAGQLVKLLRRDIIFYMAEADGLSAPYIFPAEPEHETGNLEQKMLRHAEYSSKKERQAAEQAFCSGEPAGQERRSCRRHGAATWQFVLETGFMGLSAFRFQVRRKSRKNLSTVSRFPFWENALWHWKRRRR